MNNNLREEKWSERQRVGELCSGMNVILVDADYVDKVAFDLIVNFERMIGRRIPQADMARWLECIALDGGLREGNHETQVVFIHQKTKTTMENFVPGNYANDLTGKAFQGKLGEFILNAYAIEAIADSEHLLCEALKLVCQQKEVKRVMVIPNAENDILYNNVREALRQVTDEEKRITVFAMQPMAGGNFRQEILGYSLMAALGIRGDEIKTE